MNKAIIIIGAIWLAVLTYLTLAPSQTIANTAGAPVVAYVHGDSLQKNMKLIQTLEASLFSNVAAIDSLLKAEAAPMQAEAQELITYANSGSATDDEIAIAQTRINEIEATLQQMQAEAENRVLLQEQTMQATVAAFLSKTLKEYSLENDIDLVLNWGLSGEGVLFGTEPFDITEDVIERLNSEE